jgi:hypothetical protein
MNLWQTAAADKMAGFMKDILPISEVSFCGSVLEPNSLDIFSDVDMKIRLMDNAERNIMSIVETLSERFCNIFGYEIHTHNDNDVLRVCFENGWRFDLTFIYPNPKEPPKAGISFLDNVDRTVNAFWFLSSMVLVKLGRKDFLIAAHLALELCQLNIVIQMLIRDEEKKADFHRFGDGEVVPVLRSLMPQEDKNEVLSILFSAAEHMDKISATVYPKYVNRSDTLKALCRQLRTCGQ